MADDYWTDVTDLDYYEDIQKKIPGIGITSGYRTPEYQEDMRRRGYKPARNSQHLDGAKLDFVPPKGKDWNWLEKEISRHYPEAKILNEGDHLDVRFPGYTGAPALGGAAAAGIVNPNRKNDYWTEVLPEESDDYWSVVEPPAVADEDFYKKVSDGQSISASDPLSFWDRISQRAQEMAGMSGQGLNAAAARFLYENMTGMTDEQKEAFRQGILQERQGQGRFWNDQDERSDSPISNFFADLLGDTAGDLNPTALIGPGGSVGARIAGNAAINAGIDAAVQGAEMGQGLQEEFDLARTGMNALAGAGIQGGAEVIGALARRMGKQVTPTEDGGITVHNEDGSFQSFDPEGQPIDEGLTGTVSDEASVDLREVPDEDLGIEDELIPYKEGLSSQEVRTYNNDEAMELIRRRTGVDLKAPAVPRDIVQKQVKSVTRDWKNAPEFEVVDDINQLPENIRDTLIEDGADDAMGFVGPDGKVYVMAHNLESPDEVSSVVFHEALGHKGLSALFREQLDNELERLYKSNESLRADVDSWIERRGDPYQEADRPLARSIDEVLAERSENGQIDVSLFNRIKQIIKNFARRAGINLRVSDAEVERILGLAHREIVQGGRQAEPSGLRYMRRRRDGMLNQQDVNTVTRKAKENNQKTGRAGSLNLDRIDTNKDIKPLQAEIAKTFPKERMTHEDLKKEAAKRRITIDEVEDIKYGLENVERDVLAARNLAVSLGNRRANLARQIEDGDTSERTLQQYAETLSKEVALLEQNTVIASAAGRLLNQYNIMAKSNARASQGMRFSFRNIDETINTIRNSNLPDGKKLEAQLSIVKLSEGETLSKEEIKNLKKVFPAATVREMIDPRTRKQQIADAAANLLNMPRSIMSSMDLSAPFRQGLFLINRKEFWKAYVSMFKYLGSERAYKALSADIESRPTFDLMRESGLELSGIGKQLTNREEDFMSTWAEKLPGIGKGIKLSERAYVGFLNKLRADTFDSLLKLSKDAGIDPELNPKALKDIAWFVNAATGRGSLGQFTQAGPILNGVFFSPRLISSRISLLYPPNYVKLSPVVRREAVKSLISLGAIASTVAALFAAGGADVETDPRSSDFAKIRTGNSRYDILGGFGQYLTLGARLAMNEKKTAKGDIQELGKKYGSDTRLDVLEKFFENKVSPVTSFVLDYLRGKTPIGEPFEPTTAIADRFVPMFWQDVKDVIMEEGEENAWMAIPGIFGIGIQTYDENAPRDKEGNIEKEDYWETIE